MLTIVETDDWTQLLATCSDDDLATWHPRWLELDWHAMLQQPGWHLLTDGDGSWCLLEPWLASWDADHTRHLMGHVIIAPKNRGKRGVAIGLAMLDWMKAQEIQTIVATFTERKTGMYLARLGFEARQEPPLPGNAFKHL